MSRATSRDEYIKQLKDNIYLNSTIEHDVFIPFTISNIRKTEIPVYSTKYKTILKKIIEFQVPITAEFKKRAIKLMEQKLKDTSKRHPEYKKEITGIIQDIEDVPINEEMYEDYTSKNAKSLNKIVDDFDKAKEKTLQEESLLEQEPQIEEEEEEEVVVPTNPLSEDVKELLAKEFDRRGFSYRKIKSLFKKFENDEKGALEYWANLRVAPMKSKKISIDDKAKEFSKPLAEEDKLLAEASIFSILNEEEVSDGYYGLADDFLEAFKNIGYSNSESDEVMRYVSSLPKNQVVEILQKITSQNVPLSLDAIKGVNEPDEGSDPRGPETSTASASVVPVGSPDPDPDAQDPLKFGATGSAIQAGTSGEKLPYKERYHENSILLYFGNSSYPKWDTQLESNVMKMEASKEEVVSMMEDIIEIYGKKIFVSKRKSDTREEFNELIQLQMFIMKNLKRPDGQTASVKLADLIKIDRMANGGGGGGVQNSQVVVNSINPVSPSSVPENIMTKSEDAFIKNYDAYMTRRNLNLNYSPDRAEPVQKISGSDPRNIGIIKGNNKISIERHRVPRN